MANLFFRSPKHSLSLPIPSFYMQTGSSRSTIAKDTYALKYLYFVKDLIDDILLLTKNVIIQMNTEMY